MSVDNFIPQVWSARIMQILQKTLVYAMFCNRNYEGEIVNAGDTVRINSVGPVSVGNYTKNVTVVTPEVLTDAQAVLTIDQSKYFCFALDDVDKAQGQGNILGEGMRNAAYALRDVADQYIASLYTQATSITAVTPVNSLNAHAVILSLRQKLNELNIPSEGRICVVPPWFATKLTIAKLLVENTTNEAWTNGKVGRVAGFDIHESNNVPTTNGGTEHKIIAGTNMAISFAEQINQVEAFRPQTSFGDAVKGLQLYGAKVLYPDALAVADCSELAEP
ncbi:P22 coat protein - protein 5 domain protein [Candidatus Pacearchaeota archaeon]|jgi:hypothetical protein|nr:P22 coat protein - protein 5 domain protein [Candidatus Pacearchaeota archaeon]